MVALVVVTVAVSLIGRLGLSRQVLWACARAILQLAAVSLIITAALAHLALAAAFGLVMFVVAVFTSAGRCGVRDRWWWVALAMAAGIAPVLLIVFLSGTAPLNGAALVPIAGIIIGNTMTGHTLVGRKAFDELRTTIGGYEAGLAIGLERPQVIRAIIDRTRAEAVIPNLDSTRTVGLVTLPGAFVGVLLGGGSPIQAGAAQLLVLFGILAAQFVTVTVAAELIGTARLLPVDLRERLRP
ncbi:ABC transporter permease [Ammonicoccus fulvus]|uniref:ABC transporter permease n=1 Tax=Ammonicoccus fulvus TaxID=3138240 RepID=A0ABZ3FTK2_9ACTN